MRILDATCGYKGIWYQKNHPFVTFIDMRKGFTKNTPGTKIKNRRRFKLQPDVIVDWTKGVPFNNESFDMVIFDPPHLMKDKEALDSSLTLRYGRLDKSNYKEYLGKGINELFRVLKPEGVFILKWSESCVKVDEIIKLMPYPPLFGSNTKSKGHTANFWIVFLKYNVNQELKI